MFTGNVIQWLTRYKAEPRCVQKTGGLAFFCLLVILLLLFLLTLVGGNLQMSWTGANGQGFPAVVPRGQQSVMAANKCITTMLLHSFFYRPKYGWKTKKLSSIFKIVGWWLHCLLPTVDLTGKTCTPVLSCFVRLPS